MGESASTLDSYDPSKKLTHLTHDPLFTLQCIAVDVNYCSPCGVVHVCIFLLQVRRVSPTKTREPIDTCH